MYNLLSKSFLEQPWGMALFIVLDIAVLVLILALNYRWCCKRILDILFSLVGLAVFFAFFLVFYIVQIVYNNKTKSYGSLFEKRYFIGKREKITYCTEFACKNENGELTQLGKVLRATKIAYYPRLADIFSGRFSFVGPVPLSVADYLAVKAEDRARFSVRPGLISSLEKFGGESLTYADMFEEDAEYAEHLSLWKDISYFCLYFIVKLRGDRRNKLGECAEKSYVEALFHSGDITEEQATEYRTQGEEKLQKVLSFREEKARFSK